MFLKIFKVFAIISISSVLTQNNKPYRNAYCLEEFNVYVFGKPWWNNQNVPNVTAKLTDANGSTIYSTDTVKNHSTFFLYKYKNINDQLAYLVKLGSDNKGVEERTLKIPENCKKPAITTYQTFIRVRSEAYICQLRDIYLRDAR